MQGLSQGRAFRSLQPSFKNKTFDFKQQGWTSSYFDSYGEKRTSDGGTSPYLFGFIQRFPVRETFLVLSIQARADGLSLHGGSTCTSAAQSINASDCSGLSIQDIFHCTQRVVFYLQGCVKIPAYVCVYQRGCFAFCSSDLIPAISVQHY